MASEEHMQRVEAHYRALGMKNPHAAHFSAMRGRGGSGGGAKSRSGGLGSGKGASRYERTSAKDRRAANKDKSFGYFDEVNKRYVPALIDMIDGGGRNTRGDEFVGGPLSGVLNNLGVDPYGSQRERMFVSPNTSPFAPQTRPRVRPASVENAAAMQAQEASFNQSNPTPMTAQEMSFTQPSSTPQNLQEVSFTQPNPTPMTAQEMSFTQPRSTPQNLQEISFTQPVSNPFMGPTYDMAVDSRAQFNSLTGGPLGSGGNISGGGSGNLSMLRSQSVTGGAPEGFSRFLEMAKNDPNMSFLMNDPEMAKAVYDRMVASGTRY